MTNNNYENEVWKTTYLSDHYAVSNYGRVKRLEHYADVTRGKSTYKRHYNEQMIKPVLSGGKVNYRYQMVNIDGKLYYVHRLVAMAFIPQVEGKPEVDHIDGDRFNNCVDNLRWVSR